MKLSILILTLILFSSKIFAWGNAELFVSIADYGRYTVSLNGQYINDRDGRYEFFNVPSGRCELVIAKGPFLLYRDWIIVTSDARTVVEFSSRFGLRVVDVINFRNQSYGNNNGYNNGYGNNNGYGYNNGNGWKKNKHRDRRDYGGSCEPRRDDDRYDGRRDDRRDDNRGNDRGNSNRGNDNRDRFIPNNSLGNNNPFDNNDKKPVNSEGKEN